MEKGKNVAVYCGSRYGINPAHTAFAGMAGELLAKNGYTMIYGGGSVGLMGIAADAALAAGGKVVGIIPEVFIAAEQAHRLITELIEVPDLMARKRKMIEAGDAFLILPGGFGTLEEFADTAVHYHIYTEETNRPPIIIANIEGIYDPLRALFENWKSAEFITADEWENIHFISSIKELLQPVLHVGIDIGSTTVKVAALSPYLKLVFGRYARHMSDIRHATEALLSELQQTFPGYRITASVSGSGGMGLSQLMGLPFCQEILAETKAIRTFHPETDIIIELGGEDEKITYLRGSVDQRMNGACAGGTGAFIDRMASLLSVDAAGLGALAKNFRRIYPIASRCGVFAKTDIQTLLNEGAAHEDIAASVFQSVVNQTISGLACGRPIRGKVAFLGGPLTFIPALRDRFQETLSIADEDMIIPEHGELYVAIGAAVSAMHDRPLDLERWLSDVRKKTDVDLGSSKTMDPLFADEEEYRRFTERHARFHAPRENIADAKGPCWLGIDAGSTTIKAILLDEDNRILYEYYAGNKGTPLDSTKKILRDLYDKLPPAAYICGAGVTGYGEELIRQAIRADTGEVETMAHYRGARHFLPDVTTILDIGGQDMKCCRIKDGAVDEILLNEACSSGCGSFLDTFAQSLGMDIREFSKLALTAGHPADLGSRCTVFMNSRVREAQKNGVSIADISAGLSYSVIKNALYKVIRLRDASELGKKIVVQGGTFYNDAVLRALEKLLGCTVVRPDVAGLMGAYGIALITRDRYPAGHATTLIAPDGLASLSFSKEAKRCPGCGNHCMVTIIRFHDGRSFVTGNRCERGASIMLTGKTAPHSSLPNIYRWKYDKIFNRKSLSPKEAARGTVGIPRTMNMYEDFPYWHAFFTGLGYRVITSSGQIRGIPTEAMETIPSYSECFPVKLSHAHIYDLAGRKPDFIWYPCVDKGPDEGGANSFHCPMVTSYPETIQANMDEIFTKYGTRFLHPFLPLHHPAKLHKILKRIFRPFKISGSEIDAAQRKAEAAREEYKMQLYLETQRILQEIEEKKLIGIVLAGRPYHADPAINHSIPDLINQLGMAVLSEDGIAMMQGSKFPPLRVLNQWTWHSRLYRSADYVTRHAYLELVELNSFGCGLDAVVTDQVQEIMSKRNRLYTSLKITYDLSRTAVILSQTGGACRASNYIGFLHKALDDAGLSRIPVISLNTRNLEPQSGFRLTFTLIRRLIKAAIYGDALQQCLYRTRPYEKSPGSAETLYRKWQEWKHLDGTFSDNLKDTFGRYLLEWYRRPLEKAVKISKRFHEITNITRLAKRAARFLSLGNRAGEGWFLTADMTDLLHHGCRGIICLQPFGCLPNHITGEGMIHKLHMAYPEAVFLPLDCDASASEANQENRLKLMMNSLTEKEPHGKTLPFIRNTISARKGKVL